ncbi:MAG: hypothetical protein NVS2B16_20900 [Chloroflexota bacterium]
MGKYSTGIQPGMDVVARDGQKIGTVVRLHDDHAYGTMLAGETDVTETVVAPRIEEQAIESVPGADTVGAMGPVGATVSSAIDDTYINTGVADGPSIRSDTGYIEVEEGGLFGLGAHHLFVPCAAVLNITPERVVEVDCNKGDCLERFGEKPAWLGDR